MSNRWPPNWPGRSGTTRSSASSSVPRPAGRPGCGRTSEPRCGRTTCPSVVATPRTATPVRPSGPRREAAADGTACGAHHGARAALRGRETRDHAPHPQGGRDAAPARAALVPGHPGHRRRAAGQGRRRRPDAPGARALRRRGPALLPRVVQGAQRALLPAPRFRGRAGGAAAGGGPRIWTMWRAPQPTG